MFRLVSRLTLLLFIITVLSYLGTIDYRFEILSHFRFQYFFLFLLSAGFYALWLTHKSSKAWLSISLIGIALNTWALIPYYMPHADSVAPHVEPPTEFHFLLANVLASNTNSTTFIHQIKASDADFVAVLELSPHWELALRAIQSDYPYYKTVPQRDNFGIALYSKHPLNPVKVVFYNDETIPSITASANIKGKSLSLIVTHPFPPISLEAVKRQRTHFKRMIPQINSNTPTLLAGDLNTALWSNTYKNFIKETKLYNTRLEKGIQGTWPATLFTQIPIDHILVSPSIRTKSIRTLAPNGSDHLPLLVELSF